MNSAMLRTFAFSLSLLAAGALNAQTRNRLADPQPLTRAGNGWAVDAATGALSLAVPIATVPGEIPVTGGFFVGGMPSAEEQITWTSEVIWHQPTIWYSDSSNLHRPILGTLHFGYISNATTADGVSDSATFALENGTTYRQEDWLPFTSYNSTFTLPPDFGLASVAVGSVMVSNTQLHAQYQTNGAGLGTTVNALVQSVLPVGHATPTQFYVILDKDRARVMGFLSGLNAWAPLLWLDRFGHHVTFQWTMNTAGVPSGVTALHSVVVSNQRAGQTARGLQAQWATWTSGNVEKDLLRLDYIGIDAPSLFVRGFPGQASLAPSALGYTPAAADEVFMNTAVAGVVGRPTSIQVGFSSAIPQPVWTGYAGAPPAITPVGTLPTDPSPRVWAIVYDTNLASITDITDPMGVLTHFDYGTDTFPYPYPQGEHPTHGTIWKLGVNAATSTDNQVDPASQVTPQLKRTWDRGSVVSNSWTTTYQEWWPSAGNPDKQIVMGFGSSTQPIQYGNAKLALLRLLSVPGGVELSKAIYTNGTNGLDGSQSVTNFLEVSSSGAATYRLGYIYGDGNIVQSSRYAGPGGGSDTALEQTNFTYDINKSKLDTNRATNVWVVTTNGSGTNVLPTRTTATEYDATTRLPKKAYQDGGTDGKLGQTFIFDAEGRLFTQANFASFSTDGVATTITDYGTDGFPASAITSYTRPANQTGAASVSQSGTYDSAGRVRTQVDALGVTTTLHYDTWGHLTDSRRQGESIILYSYPSFRTRSATQDGRVITDLTDGFGRLVRRTLPDGRKVEYIYDLGGRAVVQKEFNTNQMSSRSTVTGFDVLGRLTSSTTSGGTLQGLSYSASADLKQTIVTTSVAYLSATRKEYRNVLGQVVRVEEPTGGVSTMVYDGTGKLYTVTTTDSSNNSQTRTFTNNSLGLMTSKAEPETGNQTYGTFNALGKPTVVNEAVGTGDLRTRTILYDGLGRVCKISSNPGIETLETFFEGALMTGATGGGANPATMAFTYKTVAEGRRLAIESTTLAGVPNALAYAFLDTGQLDTITYQSGRIIGYTYDSNGRITGIQDRTGGGSSTIVSNIIFDDWGQRSRLTFASGAYSDWGTQDMGTHLKDWTIGYTTGGLGDPANPRAHTYDLAERLTKAGEWQSILHDGVNRLGHVEAPALGVTAIDLNYDVFGNNISQQMSGSSSSSFNNFSLGVLPTNKIVGGTTGWLPNGRGEAMALNQGTSTVQALGLVWDALGRVAQVNTNFGTVQSYTYAPSGLRIRVQDTATPANNRRYAYTSGGLLMSEFGGPTGANSIHSGQKAIRVPHRPDQFSAISQYLGNFSAGEVVQATVWFKSPNGIHGEMFLGDAGGPDPYDNSEYTSLAGNGGWQQLTLTHTMTHADAMYIYLYSDQWGVPNYNTVPAHSGTIYDDVLVTGSLRGLVLNEGFEGAWPNGAWGAGVDGVTQEILGQEDPGLWRRDVIYLGGEAVAEVDGAGVHELHSDHLGSPRIITSRATAQIEGKQAYGPYGESLPGQAAGYVPLTGYTGHLQNDPSGLIYMRGRFYSPSWHRFVNSDQGADPNSWNQMAYAGGSPFMGTDPSGMMMGSPVGRWWWGGGSDSAMAFNEDGAFDIQAEVGVDGELTSIDLMFVRFLQSGWDTGKEKLSFIPTVIGSGGSSPQTPKPPKYKSFNDCFFKEAWDRGVWTDVAFAVANGATMLDPSGISGALVGAVQMIDASTQSPMQLGTGAVGLTGGTMNLRAQMGGMGASGTIMNRGYAVSFGNSTFRSVPGFSQAMSGVATALSAASAVYKAADIAQYCKQFDK